MKFISIWKHSVSGKKKKQNEKSKTRISFYFFFDLYKTIMVSTTETFGAKCLFLLETVDRKCFASKIICEKYSTFSKTISGNSSPAQEQIDATEYFCCTLKLNYIIH